jgi:hypothetical protein
MDKCRIQRHNTSNYDKSTDTCRIPRHVTTVQCDTKQSQTITNSQSKTIPSKYDNKKQLFYCLHQNIQSLNAKRHELETFLDTLDGKIHAVCLTEHWMRPFEPETFTLDGYTLAACFTRPKIERGGSCIFLKENIEYTIIKDITNEKLETVLECSGIVIPHFNTVICCIYRPPKEENIRQYFIELNKILEKIIIKYNHQKYNILICGDFNINVLDKKNNNTIEFLDILKEYNLHPTVHEATRITTKSKTAIDNIFTNRTEEHCKINVIYTSLSDHTGQICTLQVDDTDIDNSPEICEYRNLSDKNLQKLHSSLDSVKWDNILIYDDVDDCYSKFYEILTEHMNKICPNIIKPCKNINKKKWVNKNIKDKLRTKRELYKNMIQGRTTRKEYNDFKNKLKYEMKIAEKTYNTQFITKAKNKIKATWMVTKRKTGKSKIRDKGTLEKIKIKDKENLIINEKLDEINKQLRDICPDVNKDKQIDIT